MSRKIVCVDWDHTLMDGKTWLPGAQDALKRFRELNYVVVIHSCNNKSWIEKCLNEVGIVVDYISTNQDGKPAADIYIDDRGYRFPRNGSWVDELPRIMDTLNSEED